MPARDPFTNIPQDKEQDFRFLLERIYWALKSDIEAHNLATKGKVGEHEGRVLKLEESVNGLEACPCGKRHDPGSKCSLFLLENEVLKNRWRNAGIYTGFFTAGALFYYLAQLALAILKVK